MFLVIIEKAEDMIYDTDILVEEAIKTLLNLAPYGSCENSVNCWSKTEMTSKQSTIGDFGISSSQNTPSQLPS